MDAKFASTYNYSVEAASTIKTKIVPVPPPEVFEEIVRAKVQQRRDEEKRQQWREEVVSIATALDETVSALQASDGGLKAGDAIGSERAKAVQATIKALAGDYQGKLTTNHWAVVASTDLRREADDHLDQVVKDADKLVGLVTGAAEAGQDTAGSLCADALAHLGGFQAALQKIIAAVKPAQA